MKKFNRFGNPLRTGAFQGRVHPDYDRPEILQVVNNGPCAFERTGCEILLDSRNRVGALAISLKENIIVNVVIKKYRVQGIDRIKSIFMPSKALRAWTGAMALEERGISTPQPVAYYEERGLWGIKQSYFISKRIYDVEEIRTLFLNLEEPGLRRLLGELTRFIRLCHEQGILHKDLSDGNILVKERNNETFQFFMIDTNRIRIKKRIFLLGRIKNLIRLGVPPELQSFFLNHYRTGMPGKRIGWFWYSFHKKIFTWYIRLKKALKLRQLTRKLKIQ